MFRRNTRSESRRSRTAESSSRPVSSEDIARMAYELFERRGRIHGHDQQDWFTAEQMVRQRSPGGLQRTTR